MRRDLFEPVSNHKFRFNRVAHAAELSPDHIARIVSDLVDRFDPRMNYPMELLNIMLEGVIDKTYHHIDPEDNAHVVGSDDI